MNSSDHADAPCSPDWLEPIDHTADIGIVVHAPDLGTLFSRAAWAMFETLTNIQCVRPDDRLAVTVEAPDIEALMVRWLSELNFLHESRSRVFSRFDVLNVTQTTLSAQVYGEHIDPGRHTVHTEIKAVTYHRLRIEFNSGEYTARIIFDV